MFSPCYSCEIALTHSRASLFPMNISTKCSSVSPQISTVKRKFEHWWWTIPLISTKRTITSHLKLLIIERTMMLEMTWGQAQKSDGVKQVDGTYNIFYELNYSVRSNIRIVCLYKMCWEIYNLTMLLKLWYIYLAIKSISYFACENTQCIKFETFQNCYFLLVESEADHLLYNVTTCMLEPINTQLL